jgi:hypothetical protein
MMATAEGRLIAIGGVQWEAQGDDGVGMVQISTEKRAPCWRHGAIERQNTSTLTSIAMKT